MQSDLPFHCSVCAFLAPSHGLFLLLVPNILVLGWLCLTVLHTSVVLVCT